MRVIRWVLRFVLVVAGGLALAAAAILLNLRLDRVVVPPREAVLNGERVPRSAEYDVMGRAVSPDEATALLRTDAGRKLLSPAGGAVRLGDGLDALGREVFYGETWENEIFLSDVLGLLEGGLSPLGFATAIFELGGRGTSNLQVKVARDTRIGDRTWRAGETVATGLSVRPGDYVPLGVRVIYDGGRMKVGVTCALCHAAYDPASGKVVEGAPNTELNLGLILALSANPAALFGSSGVAALEPYQTRPENIVRLSNGVTAVLPDPDQLAHDVRIDLASWPPGRFDATTDGASNPTKIPAVWTAEAYPYGWSGQGAIGPFRGLWTVTSWLHGLSADPTALAGDLPVLRGLDPEFYLGTILQRAARPELRFDPTDGRKPSDILGDYDLNHAEPGLARVAALPSFSRATYVSATSLVPVLTESPAMRPSLALAAFLNRLQPPAAAPTTDGSARGDPTKGRAVFEKAGCLACHSGPALTSHRIWPASVIGTEPSRAGAFAWLDGQMDSPRIFALDTPVPIPDAPVMVDVPVSDEGQLKLAWAHNRTGGGYKVPSLIGLSWRAPYLHEGGVAVGPGPDRLAGVSVLAKAALPADPENSLLALVDRELREKVVSANRASAVLRAARVTGQGHPYWVDQPAGYAAGDQRDLLAYLLSLDRLQPPEAPPGAPPAPPNPPAQPGSR